MIIRPQPGPQEQFLASCADIVIFGGGAGPGKTFALLMEDLRHSGNKDFSSVTFRRTTKQIKNPGGLWDECGKIFPLFGAKANETDLEYKFPSGSVAKFAHMEHEKNRFDWQGSQIPLINFDELTHFTRAQFFYMLSRNRSMCGVKPYIRATTNPDADSWVAEFIAWWIDQITGFPIPERSGVLRYFVMDGDNLLWADTAEELKELRPGCEPKSVTFIAATVYDNKILLEQDPSYLSNLKALPLVDRERLLGGNWKIRPAAGLFFKRTDFQIVDALPADIQFQVRYWDRAATEKTQNNDPDWTAGTHMLKFSSLLFGIADVTRFQSSPLKVQQAILNTASQDTQKVPIILEQDPGQAGKVEVGHLLRQLAGYSARAVTVSQNKVTRAGPFSAQCEAGNVLLLRGKWNEPFINELEAFPEGKHDDQVDSASGAFNYLANQREYKIY